MKFQISLTDPEWEKLSTHTGGRKIPRFLSNEINKVFRNDKNCDAPDAKIKCTRIGKTFELGLSEEVECAVNRMANKLGIAPATLITRLFVLPMIDSKEHPLP